MRHLFAAAALAFALASQTEAEVLIGVAGPMSGKLAWTGTQLRRGAEMAVANINAAGGVLGQQVRLIVADDFCDPRQALAAAESWSQTVQSSSSGITAPEPPSLHRRSMRPLAF